MYMLGYIINMFFQGLTWVVTIRFLEEIVPSNMLGICFTLTPLAGWFGYVVSNFSVDFLPTADAPVQDLLENRTYQILMCAPIFFAAICIIALFTWVNHESPFFYMSHG